MKKIILLVFLSITIQISGQCEAPTQNGTATANDTAAGFGSGPVQPNQYTVFNGLTINETYNIFPAITTNPTFITIRDVTTNAVIASADDEITFVATTSSIEVHYFFTSACNNSDVGVNVFVGVNTATLGTDNFTLKNLNVYPNPFVDNLQINTNEIIDNISIYDLEGAEIKNIIPQQTNELIDLSTLAKGVYILEVTSNNKSVTRRIVKE